MIDEDLRIVRMTIFGGENRAFIKFYGGQKVYFGYDGESVEGKLVNIIIDDSTQYQYIAAIIKSEIIHIDNYLIMCPTEEATYLKLKYL